MNKRYDYKDQEFNLKMRIKFLEKKLREPDHDVEKYQEWESNLEIVREELTNLQLKKFKFFLSKWIHNFKTGNQTVNVIDCMFASMEEEEQKEMAVKWYHRVIKEKDIKHYQLYAQYTREENQMLKKRINEYKKANKKIVKQSILHSKNEYRRKEKQFKKQKDQAIKQSKEAMSNKYDELLRSQNKDLNFFRNEYEKQQEFIKSKDNNEVFFKFQDSIKKLEEKNFEIIGKLQKEKTEIITLRENKRKILDDFKKVQKAWKLECQNILKLSEENEILKLTNKQLIDKLVKFEALQEEIDKRAEVYKEGLIKSGLKNILQKEDS